MQLHQRLDQSETQARTAAILAAEAVEDVGLDVDRDAGAGVGDDQAHLPLPALGRQGDQAAGGGMAQGVLGQMVEHLGQAPAVAADQARRGLRDRRKANAALLGLPRPALDRRGQQGADIDVPDLQRGFAGVDLGHVQDIVD